MTIVNIYHQHQLSWPLCMGGWVLERERVQGTSSCCGDVQLISLTTYIFCCLKILIWRIMSFFFSEDLDFYVCSLLLANSKNVLNSVQSLTNPLLHLYSLLFRMLRHVRNFWKKNLRDLKVHALVGHYMILLRAIIWLNLALCIETRCHKVCTIILFYHAVSAFGFLGLHCCYYLKQLEFLLTIAVILFLHVCQFELKELMLHWVLQSFHSHINLENFAVSTFRRCS